jgi:hypothetical protein
MHFLKGFGTCDENEAHQIKAGEEVELRLRGQNKLSLTQNIRGPATVSIIEVHKERTTKQATRKTPPHERVDGRSG